MHLCTLVTITPSGPVSVPALRALLRSVRRVRGLAGFSRWQTFRAMDASGALLVVLDWDSTSPADIEQDEVLKTLRAHAGRLGFQVDEPRVLRASFDRQLRRSRSVATLMRVGRLPQGDRGMSARDSDMALKALAAPGSTRLYGAHAGDGSLGLCRIDFDTEDGIWHFLESPLRRAWSARCEDGHEEECWAINLPRLDYERPPAWDVPTDLGQPPRHHLNVELSFQNQGRWARLRFQGRIDDLGLRRCERLCQAIMEHGCERLEVDVSGLSSISAEALVMLAQAARRLKQKGSQFVLIDNEERVRRVTRSKHLEASMR